MSEAGALTDCIAIPTSIAVLMIQGIGDVVCATPLVLGLRQAHPQARIVGILKSPVEAQLFGGASELDGIIYCDPGQTRMPRGMFTLVHAIRAERPDAFVVATDIDAIKAPILSWLSGARWRVGESWSAFSRLYTHRVLRNARQHKVQSNWDILEAFGVEVRPRPYVHIAGEDAERVTAVLRRHDIGNDTRLIAVHPGSGETERHKRWPEDSYVDLIRALRTALTHRIVLVGGPQEAGLCERIQRKADGATVVLAGALSLRETAALLRRADVVIGADSGVMHIAAACGTPTISAFGPTSPERTAAYRAPHIVTHHLPCSPCYPALPRGCGHPRCLQDISTTEILNCVYTLVNRSLP